MSTIFSSLSKTTQTRLATSLGLILLGSAAAGSAQATTYYVRTDGGDATQCNGLSDAAYTGAGNNCAWGSLHVALPASGTARIAGGDTVIVGPGSHKIGYGAIGAVGGRCYSGGTYDCYLAPVPSGTATAKTRILGKGYDSGCAAPPKLWGNERVYEVLNLEGSSNVEVGCLEITDQSDCVEGHVDATVKCKRDAAPYGAWASIGITASDSKNVWLHDLNIHGLAHTAIHAGRLTDWTVERVKMNANGWGGWNGDIGTSSSNAGQMIFRNVEIAWNGCGQKWQTGEVWGCWAQQAGGYGDGIGTYTTGGQWLFEDSFVHHNTSDGIDLLYLDGGAGTSVTVRRVYAQANAGNQIKTKGNALIENSIVVGQCSYFNGKDYMQFGDQCRAQGNALSVGLIAGQTATVRHNTVIGEGDCLLLTSGGNSTSKVLVQNNNMIGQPDWLAGKNGNPEQTCFHYDETGTAQVTYASNLVYNTKGSCPSGSVCNTLPGVKNMTMADFDGTPASGSPLIDRGTTLAAVVNDFYLKPRPSGNSSDIGAIEVQAGGSTTPPPTTPPPTSPTCTHNAPSFSMNGSTSAVAAGSTVNYTLTIKNNDSAECTATTYNLAKTVPAGWTGTLGATTVSLAPGATTTASLAVTSASSATAGSYGLGAGISSAVGSTHTANASATYTVQSTSTTPPPATGPLADTISTDKSSYYRGQTAKLTSKVTRNGVAIAGASVEFIVDRPDGSRTRIKTTTNSSGYAYASYTLGSGTAYKGTFWTRADAISGSDYVASTAISFTGK